VLHTTRLLDIQRLHGPGRRVVDLLHSERTVKGEDGATAPGEFECGIPHVQVAFRRAKGPAGQCSALRVATNVNPRTTAYATR
jgi:hypothetical protein